jgi:hypothetical protein
MTLSADAPIVMWQQRCRKRHRLPDSENLAILLTEVKT